MGNRPEAVASIFAIALAGGVAVPLSTFSTAAELRVLLARSAVAGVLTQTRLLGARPGDDVASLVADDELPFLGWCATVGEPSWTALIADGADHAGAVARPRPPPSVPGTPA